MKNKILFIGVLIIGLCFISCEMPTNETYSKPTIESVTLSNGETYLYYCFKTMKDGENYFNVKYNYDTEAVNTMLDKNVKILMTNNNYEVTVTHVDYYYVINRKSGNIYYYNTCY